jgi:hypothetical protein
LLWLDGFGFFSSVECKALLEAVEKSKLESFSISADQDMRHELISSIPKIEVRTLHLDLDLDLEGFKPGLLCAVRANASLYSVAGEKLEDDNEGDYNFTDFFNDEDKRKLSYYAVRNNRLSKLTASPSSLPREAWPRALTAARATGPITVYRILQVLGNSVGPVEGKRKRKRSIPYEPSS